MPERFAIYYAPARESAFAERAEAWLSQSQLEDRTVSARRYGFHATLKAPMALAEGQDRAGLEAALAAFAGGYGTGGAAGTGAAADRGISGDDDGAAAGGGDGICREGGRDVRAVPGAAQRRGPGSGG